MRDHKPSVSPVRARRIARVGAEGAHLLSLNLRSLRIELVCDGLTSALEDDEAPFCSSVCDVWGVAA